MIKKITILIVFISLQSNFIFSQDYPLDVDYYDFINYESNKFGFYGDSSAFENLYNKFDTLILKGRGQIKVMQIGASHTQADIFSAQLRGRLQTFYPGMNAGRGYVFPYRMMKTNNPYNYYTKHTGKWTVCRNVQHTTCTLGLTGISATTSDQNASFKIVLNEKNKIKYNFNSIKILHSTDSLSYGIKLKNDTLLMGQMTYPEFGYTEIFLTTYVEEIEFELIKKGEFQNKFELYGITLDTDEQGVMLHPIGINGAGLYSYTKCQLFEQQLDVLDPDWIIIAIGTNDAYTSKFDPQKYKSDYKELIDKIKSVNPDVAITMVVPNDCYLFRRKPNPNTAEQVRVIMELSKEEGCGVWNMYEIMGGFNSSILWYKAGLMASDKIHFTNAGYILLGNMFFNAFLRSYDKHIENNFKKVKINENILLPK